MRVTVALLAVIPVLAATPASAAEWTPAAWAQQTTLELRTTAPGEAEHWFPVWLAVVDDQLYVRLGARAAGRIEKNQSAPFVGVRVAGHQFDRVRGVPAPEQVARVAEVLAGKYWTDMVVHLVNHPLTLRLVPEPAAAAPTS